MDQTSSPPAPLTPPPVSLEPKPRSLTFLERREYLEVERLQEAALVPVLGDDVADEIRGHLDRLADDHEGDAHVDPVPPSGPRRRFDRVSPVTADSRTVTDLSRPSSYTSRELPRTSPQVTPRGPMRRIPASPRPSGEGLRSTVDDSPSEPGLGASGSLPFLPTRESAHADGTRQPIRSDLGYTSTATRGTRVPPSRSAETITRSSDTNLPPRTDSHMVSGLESRSSSNRGRVRHTEGPGPLTRGSASARIHSGVEPKDERMRPAAPSRTVRTASSSRDRPTVGVGASVPSGRSPFAAPDVRSVQAQYAAKRAMLGSTATTSSTTSSRRPERDTEAAPMRRDLPLDPVDTRLRGTGPQRGQPQATLPSAPIRPQQIDVRVRAAMASDHPACGAIDSSYLSDCVWQIETRQIDAEIRIGMTQVRLPSPMTLTYAPRIPSDIRPDTLWIVVEEVETPAPGRIARARTLGNVVGFLSATIAMQGGKVYVAGVTVAPDYRRQHLGQRMLEEMRRWAIHQGVTELITDVSARNAPALQFLQRFGFRFCGFNQNLYPNGEVALFLTMSVR